MNRELVELVRDRANNRCEYCQFPDQYAWLPFQIDHIIAEKHGGATEADNLALSCFYCNSFKGPNIAGIDPNGDASVAVQLFHPRREDWERHFEWTGAILCGKTAKGRATIAVLKINDFDSVEVRKVLFELGISLQ